MGFYFPPADRAREDAELRIREAEAWAAERLRLQGAESCDVLLVALGPVGGRVAPTAGAGVRVGAVAITLEADVEVVAPPPRSLPGVGEVRGWARTVAEGGAVPTLAAVDLAEREALAADRSAPAMAALRRTPVAAIALVGIWVAVYLVELAVVGRLREGGQVDELTMGGLPSSGPHSTDWWRFVASAFLHDRSQVLHVAGNAFFMVVVGGYVERLYGRLALVGTWLLTAVAANLLWVIVSSATGAAPSFGIGASGGDFGLLGLIVMLGRVQGRSLPAGLVRQMRQYAITLALLNAVLGLSIPHVNSTVHVFGFLGGIALGFVVPPSEAIGGRRLAGWERGAVVAACAVAVVALAVGGQHLASVLSGPPGDPTNLPLGSIF